MNKKQILEKYIGKSLGRASYKDCAEYNVSEFSDIDNLYLIMWEVWTGEGTLTGEGINLMAEYYGLENLAQEFSAKGGFDEINDKEKILNWLSSLNGK